MDYFDQIRLINDEYAKKFEDHAKKYKCDHEDFSIVERIISGGSKQFVFQCRRCGRPIGGAIKKERALQQNNGVEPELFDQDLYESWEDKQKSEFTEIYNAQKSEKEKIDKIFGVEDKKHKEKFFDVYNRHLSTEKWQATREKVFKRANYICEGCLEEKATQVHHIDYRNVGDELLFQLVAVCDKCHEKCHS